MARMIGTTERVDVPQDIHATYRWVVHPDTPIALVNRWGPLPGFASYEAFTRSMVVQHPG